MPTGQEQRDRRERPDRWDRFGDLLRALRRDGGMTQEALAEASGSSVRTIREMERGRVRTPQRRTAALLADALGLDGADRSRFLALAAQVTRLPDPVPPTDRARGADPASPADPLPPAIPRSPTAVQAPGVRVPGELPPAVADLTGRAGELTELWSLAADISAGRTTGTGPVVLHGPPGIGKTSLAVVAGHRLANAFPDGQLFVDLRGAARPDRVDPAEALAGFLRGLGVPDERIPVSPAERGALFRTLVRERRLLVVLDNAADEDQVRPLLPAGRHCLVLVTSRRPLAGLAGVTRIPLGVLDSVTGRELLASIIGAARVSAAPAAVDRLVQLCGGLPLALRIAGNRLAVRPLWPVERLVDQVRDQRRRLTALTAGDLGVRTAFEVSYRQLAPDSAAVFRRASLIPGPDFDAALVAAAAGTDPETAAQAAEELVDVGLLAPLGERYRYHDLVRLYAQERLDSDDPTECRTAAHDRLIAWLLRRTEQAGALFEPDGARAGSPFTDHRSAAAWLEREAGNWPAALRDAARQGRHADVIRVARALHWYSDTASHRHAWDEIFSLAVTAAQAAGRVRDEAVLLNFLGWARYFCRDRYAEALDALERALHLARRIGDQREEAWALTYSASIFIRSGRAEQAIQPCRRAAALFHAAGYPLGEHCAYNVEGSALAALGRYADAAELHRRVIEFYGRGNGLSSTGALIAQAGAVVCLGRDLVGLGRWRAAAVEFRQAGAVYRRCGATFNEAVAVYHHALALREQGERSQAAGLLREALTLFAAVSSPWWEAQTLHALASLTGAGAAGDADARRMRRRALDRCGELDAPEARNLRATLLRELAG